MGTKIRVYHPGYPVGWLDRLYDFFSGHTIEARPAGVDWTLFNRTSLRTVRGFIDEVNTIALLGDEMVRVESAWRMAEGTEGRRAQAESLTGRLRAGQVLPGGGRAPLTARWYQFEPMPGGTRLLIRLTHAPNPGLRIYLSGNLNEKEDGAWLDYAVGL